MPERQKSVSFPQRTTTSKTTITTIFLLMSSRAHSPRCFHFPDGMFVLNSIFDSDLKLLENQTRLSVQCHFYYDFNWSGNTCIWRLFSPVFHSAFLRILQTIKVRTEVTIENTAAKWDLAPHMLCLFCGNSSWEELRSSGCCCHKTRLLCQRFNSFFTVTF